MKGRSSSSGRSRRVVRMRAEGLVNRYPGAVAWRVAPGAAGAYGDGGGYTMRRRREAGNDWASTPRGKRRVRCSRTAPEFVKPGAVRTSWSLRHMPHGALATSASQSCAVSSSSNQLAAARSPG